MIGMGGRCKRLHAMRENTPTIKEVAFRAAVSVATVSRCINTPDRVAEETRTRVEEAMSSLNYRYNSLARGFATRRTKTLGVVVPTITNPVFAESTRGIQDEATRRGYQIVLANTDYSPLQEAPLIRSLRERQVDGIALTSSDLASEAVRSMIAEGFPCVLLYSTVTDGPLTSVGVDNIEGGRLAAKHLLDQGHERIAMLAGSFALSDRSMDRFRGFRECLENTPFGFDPDLVVETGFSLDDCRGAVAELMDRSPKPTAIFCSNDLLAVGAMAGLRAFGLSVPDDVSVIGFDDAPLAAFVTPALTTVRQPVYEMGRKGAELLLDCIENGLEAPIHVQLDLELVARESVAAKTG
jgi:DNA-binding LacI/PurR family transcriptional regulator